VWHPFCLFWLLFPLLGPTLFRNPTLRENEDEIHTPEMGTWESSRTFEILEFGCKGQNTSHWGVLYIVGKL